MNFSCQIADTWSKLHNWLFQTFFAEFVVPMYRVQIDKIHKINSKRRAPYVYYQSATLIWFS